MTPAGSQRGPEKIKSKKGGLGMVVLRLKLQQEDCEFEANLDNTAGSHLKRKRRA